MPEMVDERMLSNAGIAMFLKPEDEKDSFFWYEDALYDDPATRRAVAGIIEQALASRQLHARFQPVFECREGGEVVAAEALARWVHPEYGEMPPSLFLPVVEKTHMTHRLDLYILDEVCAFQSERLRAGAPTVPIAINVSRDDMMDHADFSERAIAIVDGYGLDHEWVQFELLEGALAADSLHNPRLTAVKQQIRELEKQGFVICIDDYGAGMSNIKTICVVPFDVLKIDKFLIDSYRSPTVACVLRFLIRCMGELGREVVAEGVETVEQLRFLESEGCGFFQGFYGARPLLREDLAAFLDEGRTVPFA